ncbi:MAG TPA: hypothetical protein VGQ64_05790 [Candidatus Limnocylindrales bacterium]|jgi:ABC-type transport system involved in multi-copper enzyme maturation permease subunit|nr:hypothetical protein [Candidatus Limnocylindrales bacterium]
MRNSIRLTFQMHRFELIAISIFTLVLVVASYYVAGQLDAVGYGPCATATSPSANCEVLGQRFFSIDSSQASPVMALIAILPYVAGLFLGAPIVARELERGTTRLAWSLEPSRVRWYLARTVPVLIFVVLLSFAAGVAADHLYQARSPGIDMTNAFDGYGYRGGLIAVQALVIAVGALGLGAVTGRVLPTVILALIIGALGIAAVGKVHERFTQREAIYVDGEQYLAGSRYVDQFFRLPNGTLADWRQLEIIAPEAFYSETGPTYPIVNLVVPGNRYRFVEAREAAGLGGIAAIMLVGAGVIVQRRRPG